MVLPDLRIFNHELGHTFGLYHSHGMNCSGVVIGSDCDNIEYGDRLDIMGGRALHFNAFQKERLGWLVPSNCRHMKQWEQARSHSKYSGTLTRLADCRDGFISSIDKLLALMP